MDFACDSLLFQTKFLYWHWFLTGHSKQSFLRTYQVFLYVRCDMYTVIYSEQDHTLHTGIKNQKLLL